jgi:hypothetical protein
MIRRSSRRLKRPHRFGRTQLFRYNALMGEGLSAERNGGHLTLYSMFFGALSRLVSEIFLSSVQSQFFNTLPGRRHG